MELSNFLDTKMIAHISVEAVVIGGVTYWLNSKISSVQGQVNQIGEKLQQYEAIIAQQQQIIQQHSEILKKLLQQQNGYRNFKPKKVSFVTPVEQPASQPVHSSQPVHTSQSFQTSQPVHTSQSFQTSQSDSDDEIEPEELDELLGTELTDLSNERKLDLKSNDVKKKEMHGE